MAKHLKRVLLIHWHFYTHQLIELDQINFLTGKTGVGKTTIIDALQVVLLGDTNARRFFNKAANEKSERTLEGYLAGEYGDDGDRASRSLRQGRFSSIVACEFQDSETQRMFTVGSVFDSYDVGKWANQWFIFGDRIPEHHFIGQDQTPMDIGRFRAWIRHLPERTRYQLPASNQQYQNQLAAYLGGLKKNYFTLFRRAVAFTPIQDITSFITDYICEADRSIDIHELKENLRHYRRLELQAAQIKAQVDHLREGIDLYREYQNEAANHRLFSFLVRRGEQADILEQVKAKELELAEQEARLASLVEQLARLDEEMHGLQSDLADLEQERYGSDLYKKLQDLQENIARTQDTIDAIERQSATAIAYIRQKAGQFARAAEQAAHLAGQVAGTGNEPPDPGLAAEASRLEEALAQPGLGLAAPAAELAKACRTLTGLDEQAALRQLGDLAGSLRQLAGRMKQFSGAAAYSAHMLESKKTDVSQALQQAKKQLQELNQGIKQFPNPGIKRLQALLESELSARYGRPIPVWIIADELEIAQPRWTDALEGYLHTQKFYLLVEPAWFEEALVLYDEAKGRLNLYDIGLIDIERLGAEKPLARPGSLAEKVRTDNPLVRLFVDYVLGDVICCDRTGDLRHHRKAITDSCMLYQNFVARQLNPARYRDRTIGKSAIRAQIAALEKRIVLLDRFQAAAAALGGPLADWAALGGFGEYETDTLATTLGQLGEKHHLTERLTALKQERSALDLSWLDRLITRIGQVKGLLKEKEALHRDLLANRYKQEAGIGLMRDQELPELNRQANELSDAIRSHFSANWLEETGEPRFAAEYSQRGSGQAVRNAFFSPQNRSESQKKVKWERVLTNRAEFNRLYQASVSITAENNSAFEQRLARLEQEKLPEYLDQIKQAQKLAYEQFQSDFLGKLKESIDAVTENIRGLNRTLKDRSWGNERFQFVVEPDPNYRRFYDMIMDDLLMQGYSITYAAFREKHGETIDELFRQILAVDDDVSGDKRSELDRNIDAYCNYRTYLRFDLHTIDENNEVQRLSRTLRKKSGGETQTPYYIAMLAAFVQLYRIGDRNRSCLQLIIFDEAFSKMDGERIRESIRLLRRIGFQCLISAPPDKIADIAPLVDRNICVLKDRHRSFLAYFDKQDIARIEGELGSTEADD